MSFGVGAQPLHLTVGGALLVNNGPDTLYYRTSSPVSASTNDGSLIVGASTALSGSVYIVSAGFSQLNMLSAAQFDSTLSHGAYRFPVDSTRIPANAQVGGASVTNNGPGILYYRDRRPVDASSNDGTLAAGSTASLNGSQWFQTDSQTTVAVGSAIGGAAGAVFAEDSFIDTNGTLLSAHNSILGGTWIKHTGTTGTFTVGTSSNIFGPASGGAFYFLPAAPNNADYDVSMDLVQITDNNSHRLGPIGRADATAVTGYHAYYDTVTNAYALDKLVSGARNNILTGPGPTPSGTLTLRMRGNALSVIFGGVLVLGPARDSDITAAGFAGMDAFGVGSAVAGLNGKNFLAQNAY